MVSTKPYIREGKTGSPIGDRSKMSWKKKRKISSLKSRTRRTQMKSLSTKGSAVKTWASLAWTRYSRRSKSCARAR